MSHETSPERPACNNRERILHLAAAHGAVEVLVFGSVARGEDDSESDLDLLVDIPLERLSLLDLIQLKLEISDLLGVKVDLGTVEMMRPDVREKVLSEARPLIGRDHDPLAA